MDGNPATTLWATSLLFGLTYTGLALGRVPGLRIDRAGIAVVGAAALVLTGLLGFKEAFAAVNYETLVLLFGMMVVVGHLRLSGFFERLTRWTLLRLHTPHALLAATIVLSGVLSAFLVNDVVCVALTPLIVHIARRLKLDPLPHLIALATASNIGSSATVTGNPQNMIIGTTSGIPYLRFALRLGPAALLGLALDFAVIALVYRRALRPTADAGKAHAPGHHHSHRHHRRHGKAHHRLMSKGLAVALAVVVLFFAGLPVALVALGGAAVVLLSRVRPVKTYRQVDWALLLMFTGLFMVVHAFNQNVVRHWGVDRWELLLNDPVGILSAVSAGLSNLVSNVPAVLLFEPVIQAMPEGAQETAWLALAMSSTFAGNLTVLGSVANLIVVEGARREGVAVSFWEYCKVGIPVTLLTLLLGVAWLRLVA